MNMEISLMSPGMRKINQFMKHWHDANDHWMIITNLLIEATFNENKKQLNMSLINILLNIVMADEYDHIHILMAGFFGIPSINCRERAVRLLWNKIFI